MFNVPIMSLYSDDFDCGMMLQTPVSLLLNLCVKYAEQWQVRVKAFLSSEQVTSAVRRCV